MHLVIKPLDGLGLEMHVGHGLGLVHDLGLGVAQPISLVGITSFSTNFWLTTMFSLPYSNATRHGWPSVKHLV